ncbi:unnamed protein product [Chrysoparadoxa australica]
MTDRKMFDLFRGAREKDEAIYTLAYKNGADINFQFEGRKATRGGAGRWYYGDSHWYAPDGVDGDKKDTLLHIAIKTNDEKLVTWLLSLDKIDITKENAKGVDPIHLAKALDREHLLAGLTTSPEPELAAAQEEPDTTASDAADELTRLTNSVKMLNIQSNKQESTIAGLEGEIAKYKQMLREKDADIASLHTQVLQKDREMIVMMHRIDQQQEQIKEYTDLRQAHADQFSAWGQGDYHGSERWESNAAA